MENRFQPRSFSQKGGDAESHLALDMPILFTFEKHELLLWLVEFQEDKSKFSIYKLARIYHGLHGSLSQCHRCADRFVHRP